jgi:hypothetical protein
MEIMALKAVLHGENYEPHFFMCPEPEHDAAPDTMAPATMALATMAPALNLLLNMDSYRIY